MQTNKIHGIVQNPEKIVLTSEQFRNRKYLVCDKWISISDIYSCVCRIVNT